MNGASLTAESQIIETQKRIDRGQLTALVRDAHRFALSYRWIVEQAPLQAYTSALVFAPTSSLVKKLFTAEEPDWVNTEPVVEAEWDACLQTLEGHSSLVGSVAFSPDSQRLVSGSYDDTIRVWETASGRCLQTLRGHNGSANSVAFSLDDPGRHGYGLGLDESWITCNNRNVLWLPPDYRPSCSAVQGRMISIGCVSGRVFTIGFSRDL